MKLRKWNLKKRKYEPHEIPDDWNIKIYSNDMEEKHNCAGCGKEMTFGEGYTSRFIHNITGFGFNVCPECHEKELEEEVIFRRRCENAAD